MNTEEKPASEETRQREVEAAGRVAGGLMHEFRNVLNPIVSAAWLLEVNAGDPAKVIELARRIDGFAKSESRIAARLRELLDAEAAGHPSEYPKPDEVRSANSTPRA